MYYLISLSTDKTRAENTNEVLRMGNARSNFIPKSSVIQMTVEGATAELQTNVIALTSITTELPADKVFITSTFLYFPL